MQYRSTHTSGFALGICASILHTNLWGWLITITYSGTSDKGLSVLKTQYKNPLYKDKISCPKQTITSEKEETTLLIKRQLRTNIAGPKIPFI